MKYVIAVKKSFTIRHINIDCELEDGTLLYKDDWNGKLYEVKGEGDYRKYYTPVFNGNKIVGFTTSEFYSPDQASKHAIKWCQDNPGWERICDIKNSDRLYLTWQDLTKKAKKFWEEEYGRHSAESAWQEFGTAICKVSRGFVTGKGEFYTWENQEQIPFGHNLMMVFKMDELQSK
jgi:hypothetical protein